MIDWKESVIEFFTQAAEKTAPPELGVEAEHFVVDRVSHRAVPYSGEHGIRQVLARLMERYPGAQILPDDDFFGFQAPDFTITLEPAAQLEISISPMTSVHQISDAYRAFRKNLDAVLTPLGYTVCSAGCQPVSPVAELELIPKKRYALMNEYFRHTGTGGIEMMRGTSSLQVSVDYYSEEDFRRKLQAAYVYSPVLKLLCDHSRSFEGEELQIRLKRTDIWRRTDPVRCGILPGVFSPSYGFADYADFLGRIPPIFLKRGSEVLPTGFQTADTLFAGRALEEDEIRHLLSMAFPDVRVKQFLEIRVADAVPSPFLPAYCALIKGLIYSEAGLMYAQELIRRKGLTEEDIRKAEDGLMARGWDADIYGQPASDLSRELLKLARTELPPEEKPYLEAFEAVIRHKGILSIPPAEAERLRQLSPENRE
jgi:glutamate--cysteine ligase